jgi:hypothetical protein
VFAKCVLVLLVVAPLVATPTARAHAIRLDAATRLVEAKARALGEEMRSSFTEIRGGEANITTTVRCQRVAQHRARCRWRVGVVSDYGDLAEDPELALVCTGTAQVTLVGRALRTTLGGASCQH